MSFTQLDPPLPVHVVDKGDGYALAVIDYGQEHNLIWVTGISATGEIWCAPNPQVRLQSNWTMGRARHDIGSRTRYEPRDHAVAGNPATS